MVISTKILRNILESRIKLLAFTRNLTYLIYSESQHKTKQRTLRRENCAPDLTT
jgi:hypothetical protein